jgi:DnaJ-class molecular chaperone
MTFPDFYRILGVPPSADAGAIRRAYLELARRLHPDRVGQVGTAHFQEITGAYETLSDPVKRRTYDRDYEITQASGSLLDAEPLTRSTRPPEPLVPEPFSVLDQPGTVRPSFAELFDRLERNFTGARVPKSERVEGFDIGVILSRYEASVGAHLTVALPVLRECPVCGGLGGTVLPCMECDQTGWIESEAPVHVRIPPQVRDGTVLEVPLHGVGLSNLYLRVHVAIQGATPLR